MVYNYWKGIHYLWCIIIPSSVYNYYCVMMCNLYVYIFLFTYCFCTCVFIVVVNYCIVPARVFIVVVNCFLYSLFVRSCMEERLCRIFELN